MAGVKAMMEGLVNGGRFSIFAGYLISSITLLAQLIYAQKGFTSIACCAPSNIIDHTTNITWITDFTWYLDKTNCHKINRVSPNYTNLEQARIFEIDYSWKTCYSLETVKGEEYLIRGTFLYSDDTALSTSFFILVGVTRIGMINSLEDLEVEGIFRANKEYIDFCVVKIEGNPYISQLVVRPLKGLEYFDRSSNVFRLIKRINLGDREGNIIKYPIDQSDRIWGTEPISNLTKSSVAKVDNVKVLNYTGNVRAPLQVLQTALVNPDLLQFSHKDNAKEFLQYRVILYFLELVNTVQSGQRLFDIHINNETKYTNFDIWSDGSNYKEVVLDVKANGVINVSLVKASRSLLGPICNAYEIFQTLNWVQETNTNDVEISLELKRDLLEFNQQNKVVESWYGDPCLPQPWEGLFCESINNVTVITKLDLSSQDLKGPIPTSIAKLTHLNILNLSFNKFSGQIIDFPPSSMLRVIDLRNNDLEGPLPKTLSMLPHLEIVYIGCNPIVKEDTLIFNGSKLDTSSESCTNSDSGISKRNIIIGSVAGGSLLLTVAAGVFIACFYKQKLMLKGIFNETTSPLVLTLPKIEEIVVKPINIQTFTLANIEVATQSYKTLIGEGGFGSVYRGTLPDGQEVAVKVRSATSTQGTREFQNELNLLSTIFHENLVPLLGYCSENDQEILVYPFMSNGSLQDRLYGEASKKRKLDWPTRLSIALGAARGLTHLHTYCGRGVIHRDVKSSNILLDQSMNAKVADFGFSKYAPQEGDSGASLEVRGTAGYLDPEYYTTHHLSDKSDVFSFGVVLLEIISGREPLNIHRERGEWSLVEWAKQRVRESNIDEIVDPSIKGGYHSEAMWRVVEVSLLCVEPYSAYRPCMADIVRELEDALIIENNASEYMRSIESSASVVLDKKISLPSTPTDASPILTQALPPPEPR